MTRLHRRHEQKKPTRSNTLKRSTASAYSLSGPPAQPSYPSSSLPTFSTHNVRLRSGESKGIVVFARGRASGRAGGVNPPVVRRTGGSHPPLAGCDQLSFRSWGLGGEGAT